MTEHLDETEALLLLLAQSRKEYDDGKHCSSEELKQRLKEKFSNVQSNT